MWDVYLAGVSDRAWRETFKKTISEDIKVFDPVVDGYNELNEDGKANQVAREMTAMEENCALVAFYFDSSWNGQSSMLELGNAVGRGKQVIVCLEGKVKGANKIQRFCEMQGVIIVSSLDELITTVEEYLGELAMCVEEKTVV